MVQSQGRKVVRMEHAHGELVEIDAFFRLVSENNREFAVGENSPALRQVKHVENAGNRGGQISEECMVLREIAFEAFAFRDIQATA